MKSKSHLLPRVCVVGSSNTDLVITCDRLPGPGETLLGGNFAQHAGGKGANQAVAAARAGARVSFIGARGDDNYGKRAAAGLRAEGIGLRGFKVLRGATSGIALILIGGKSRENSIAVAHSANDLLTSAQVRHHAASIQRAGSVVAPLEIPLPAVQEAARLAMKAGVPFILNPGPAQPLPASILKQVFVLTPNEHELSIVSGKKSVKEGLRTLHRSGCRHVVITLGARGVLWSDGAKTQRFPAPKVKVVDTVGAGDCFTGWLAVGIAEKLPMEKTITRAIRAAAIAVTRVGAQAGMPYRREVKNRA